MRNLLNFRPLTAPCKAWREGLAMLLAAVALAPALAQTPQAASPVMLDRVVAVVNNQAILASDLEQEKRLSALEPREAARGAETPQQTLQRLIGRALIEQQIRQEEALATEPTPEEVAARLAELRKQVPACVRQNCASDAGWKTFLDSHGLTQAQVETYLRRRIEVLRFIEMRFRQGIRIGPEEIASYYHDTLLPQYAPGEAIPPLEQVSPRIEEILLQQHVNVLFSDWLDNLRKQGEVEVLDPALETPAAPGGKGAGSE